MVTASAFEVRCDDVEEPPFALKLASRRVCLFEAVNESGRTRLTQHQLPRQSAKISQALDRLVRVIDAVTDQSARVAVLALNDGRQTVSFECGGSSFVARAYPERRGVEDL